MEDKYNAICLSLRTESLTITQRLEHSTAERDLVENNLNKEMQVLHSLFLVSIVAPPRSFLVTATVFPLSRLRF